MRLYFASVAGLVLLTGCVSGPGWMSGDDSLYGVRVIKPGMPEKEVEALLGSSASKHSLGTPDQSEVHYPTGLHVKYEAGTVQSCWTEGLATGGAAVDAEMAAAMKPGMTPAEVAERLGPPAFGYQKKSGVVILNYPRKSAEVTFQDGRLTLWRRTGTNLSTGTEHIPATSLSVPARQ